jgi:hypothetical protein
MEYYQKQTNRILILSDNIICIKTKKNQNPRQLTYTVKPQFFFDYCPGVTNELLFNGIFGTMAKTNDKLW